MSGGFDDGEAGSDGLEFLLLGQLQVRSRGAPVELGPPKQRAVLAVLLLNANRVVSTDRLIDELWGEAPPETARAALQVYVAGLRRAFGDGQATLRTRASGYVLEVKRGGLDLDRFGEPRAEARQSSEARRTSKLLHEALALWRDTPLTEFDGEAFASEAAAQLEELRLGALEERIAADLALGRHAHVISELDALVAAHPYRERFHAQLMLALYRSGRQADALAAYRAARESIASGLGLEPGPELRALERAVLDQDPQLAAPAREPEADDVAAAPTRVRGRRRLGRTAAGAAVIVVLVVIGVLVLGREPESIVAPPNSVAVIDAGSGRVTAAISVGVGPGPIAVDGSTLWIGNLVDKSVTRLDTKTRAVGKNISVPATPDAVAYGARKVWVVNGRLGTLSVIDPQFEKTTETVSIAGRGIQFSYGGVDVGEGAVWAVFGDATLVRIHPVSGTKTASRYVGPGPSAVIAAYGSIWVSSVGDASVLRYNPRTWREGPVSRPFTVGRAPVALAAGAGAIWVANHGDDTVWRIDAGATGIEGAAPIPVGDGPAALAYGAGAVWVANSEDGTVSRIDPRTNEVRSLDVGGAPSGIAVVGDEVWVSVRAP